MGTCADVSYSDVPANGQYFISTFGGGTDTSTMSCGGTADGTWPYAAGRARFGCGAKLLVEANGLECVVEVADCGPNRCVEEAASNTSCASHSPTLNLSPFVTQVLVGQSAVGWSERIAVAATLVGDTTPIGCPGGPVVPIGGAGGMGGAVGAGGTGGVGMGGAPTGGTGGMVSTGCSVVPDCGGCTGCVPRCVCEIGDAVACVGICNPGSAGAGSGSAGEPPACGMSPNCDGCIACTDRCLCETSDPLVCDEICGSSAGTGGMSTGSGGGGGLGAPGCNAGDCSGCDSCWAHCSCVTGNLDACATGCGHSSGGGPNMSTGGSAGVGAPTGALPPVEGLCSCRAPGARNDAPLGVLAFAVFAGAAIRRRRSPARVGWRSESRSKRSAGRA